MLSVEQEKLIPTKPITMNQNKKLVALWHESKE